MKGTIALGTVKGARYWTQPVRAPATVQRCRTVPSPRSRGCCGVLVVYEFFFLLSREKRAMMTASIFFCHSDVERNRGLYERKMTTI